MIAKFDSLVWVRGGTSFDKGRSGKAPRNAIKEQGGREYKKYGDQYLVWEQNQMFLNVRGEDGLIYRQDIFRTVKFFVPNKRFTKKFRDELIELFKNSEFIIENGEFRNLYKILGEYFKT